MVIFHSYVSLPEGIQKNLTYNNLLYPKKNPCLSAKAEKTTNILNPLIPIARSKCSIDPNTGDVPLMGIQWRNDQPSHFPSRKMHCHPGTPNAPPPREFSRREGSRKCCAFRQAPFRQGRTQLGEFGWLGHQCLKETGDSWGYYMIL